MDVVGVDHALVDALKTATDHGDPVVRRPLPRHRLIEPFPTRGEVDERHTTTGIAARFLDRGVEDIGADHHARATARRGVVDVLVFADPVVTQVDRPQRPEVFPQRLAR